MTIMHTKNERTVLVINLTLVQASTIVYETCRMAIRNAVLATGEVVSCWVLAYEHHSVLVRTGCGCSGPDI